MLKLNVYRSNRDGCHMRGFNIIGNEGVIFDAESFVGCLGRDDADGFRFDTIDYTTGFAYSLEGKDFRILYDKVLEACKKAMAISEIIGTWDSHMGEIFTLVGMEKC